ncbi:MAG: 3-phosphoshikimate 1-carboxyvinyltransferase [Lachnospiraceae bacterium]|nr:3-phosphoshikimate 1-carboxyvinyltransferase [Lachnospiraceae bacterium]
MESFKVKPLKEPPAICVRVPGSKSITNRAMLLAAMGEGTTLLQGVQFSEDSLYFMKALQDMGFDVQADQEACTIRVRGFGGHIPREQATIYVGSAGTAARFLTAFAAMSNGRYRFNASEQMNKRPMRELFQALEELGARFTWLGDPYRFPMEIHGMGRRIGEYRIQLNIDRSSQFLSALLMTAPLAMDLLTVELTGKRSARSYVAMTEKMMRQFGHSGVLKHGEDCYQVRKASYHAMEYTVEPDVSAACYFYAAAAITGGSAIVRYMQKESLQGDMRFLDVLEKMGCKRQWGRMEETGEPALQIIGPENGILKGVDVDMSDFSDQTLTLAAIAPFADGPVTVHGVAHIRRQESDRLQAIVNELNKMGIRCEMLEDGVTIYPGAPTGAQIETYQDHRVAMSFALTGLRTEGIEILNPECCRKTFADYFTVFAKVFKQNKL